jgi:hypothetical protein
MAVWQLGDSLHFEVESGPSPWARKVYSTFASGYDGHVQSRQMLAFDNAGCVHFLASCINIFD